jgi:hypothetical protein
LRVRAGRHGPFGGLGQGDRGGKKQNAECT